MRCHLSKYFVFSSFMLVLLCLGLISPVTSQLLTLEKTWGGSDNEEGEGIACDSSGNVYVTGKTRSFGVSPPDWDVYLLSYDSLGSLNWQRTWGGPDFDTANDVAVGPSGNIYVTGQTEELGANIDDVFVLCYDSSGNLLWQRTWGGGNDGDSGKGVAVDSSGNIYVTGDTDSFGASSDVFLLSYDSSGNLNWQRTWGGTSEDYGNDVAIGLGNIYVTGRTDSFGVGTDAFLLCYDSSGNLNWQRTWGGTSSDLGRGVAVDSTGNIYVTGQTSSFGAGSSDVFLLRYDSTGNLLWQRTWGGAISGDDGRSVEVDPSGNIYITGMTSSFGLGNGDAYLLGYDSSGRLRFEKTWGGTGADDGDDLTICGDRLCITGRTNTASRTLSEVSGTVTFPTGTEGSPTGTEATPSGTESTPTGTETTPTGSETYADDDDSILLCFLIALPPVGGKVIAINKIGVLIPYLALAGLIAAVSTVIVIKRRKD